MGLREHINVQLPKVREQLQAADRAEKAAQDALTSAQRDRDRIGRELEALTVAMKTLDGVQMVEDKGEPDADPR